MPAGLQAWDQNGNLILDLTDVLVRFVGIYDELSLNNGSTPISIPTGYTPIYLIVPLGRVQPYSECADVNITNTQLSWVYLGNSLQGHTKIPTRIIYGYF